MMKKVSAIILALVLCLSAVVVPISALELGDAQIAFELKWDKDSYAAGDTAKLSVYMDAADDLPLYTGALTIGFNSATISPDQVQDVIDSAVENELFFSYYKSTSTNLAKSAASFQTKIETANTAEENSTYDWYLKFTAAKNTGGSHDNAANNKDGFYFKDYDSSKPIIVLTFTVADGVAAGTAINAAITSGSKNCATPKQTAWKYYTSPGTGTKTADVAAEDIDLSQAVATATTVDCIHEHADDDAGVATPPACGKDGYTTYTCTKCNQPYDVVDENTALTHSWDAGVVIPATCTTDGYTTFTCGVCQGTEKRDLVGKYGHEFDETKTEANLTRPAGSQKGYYTFTCIRCPQTKKEYINGADYSVYDEAIEAITSYLNGDDISDAAKAMIQDELTKVIRAFAAYVDQSGALRRDLIESEQGVVDQVAGALNQILAVIDGVLAECEKGNHEISTYVYNNDATCKKPGTKSGTCYYCNEVVTVEDEEHPALGHDWGEWEVVSAATCGSKGTEMRTCKRDKNHIETRDVPATDKHSYESVVTPPTTTSQGYTTHTCSVCKKSYVDSYVDAVKPEFSFEIRQPSVMKLRYMDEMVLHANINGEAPEGAYVKWEATEGAEFFTIVEDNGDGKLKITPKDEGTTVFTATLYAADGSVLGTDSVEMFSRAHLLDKIGGIIRYIFGSNVKYEF